MNEYLESALFLMLGIITGSGLLLFGFDKVIYRLMRNVKTYIFDIWR